MMKKIPVIMIVIFSLFITAACGEDEKCTSNKDKIFAARDIGSISDELGLTKEQKEKLKDQRFKEQYNKTEIRNNIKLKELALRHELEKSTVNMDAVNGIVNELKELQGKKIDQRVQAILNMKQLLTEEQFEKLLAVNQRCMQRSGMAGAFKGHAMKKMKGQCEMRPGQEGELKENEPIQPKE